MTHDPDALPLDARTERRILQHRVDDAGHLLRPSDPHLDAGDVVALSTRVRRGGDNIAMRGQRHRQVAVVQGESTRPMRDDDEPEHPVSRWSIVGHLHLERNQPAEHRR